ncbi:hypothetical protein [Sandaracinus amylolyticus]|uniref:Uncharacterized protein n=1 Tax=Sandaracinus amylolyticus TaxID=927083 RepID=A0A0F6W2U7_9BACT|nr:hypothetical protein [Sandaracinus amylolyticus]AKF06011.1 hypothetical protein DB32_003160 [Sandaracinus amylolyticus]
MIAADLRVEGFDARSWTNLISLFAPGVVTRIQREPAPSDAPELDTKEAEDAGLSEQRSTGSLVIVISETGRVRKAFHSQRGRIRDLAQASPSELPMITERYRARRALLMREGAIEEIAERVAVRLERGDDYVAQWLVVARTIREVIDAGMIHVWPRPLAGVPIPTAGMVRRALDTVLPDDRALVMVIWSGSTPWTGVVLRRRRGEIDLVAGPDLIARWSGPLGGDWRRDHRFVSEGIARAVAPVHLGIYAEIGSIRRLLRSAEPGAWARAVAVRDVIVSPTPPYVAVAIGADAARAVAQRTTTWLGGIDALASLAPAVTYVRGRISEIASVTQTLGFDPLKLLAGSLARSEDGDEKNDER